MPPLRRASVPQPGPLSHQPRAEAVRGRLRAATDP